MKSYIRFIHIWILITAVLVAAALLSVSIVNGQTSQPVKVEITPYAGNPILTKGAAGEWDSGFVLAGSVIYKDGLYHMFYTGGENWVVETAPRGIGYATSEDGLTWTKFADNPILRMDPAISSESIFSAFPVVDGDTWVLYFNALGNELGYTRIFRASAPAPSGPWTIDQQPVLQPGGVRDWDRGIDINSVLRTPDQYVLYYSPQYDYWANRLGMATSPDGITWTKYNDSTTTKPPYANSDPVFAVGETPAWDSSAIFPVVLYTDRGWEMFYEGSGDGSNTWNLGYATSPDGITWKRFGDKPVMTNPPEYGFWLEGVLIVDNQYYIYHDMFNTAAPLSATSSDIGVSIGTVTYQ